jgi:hypothetical protein
MPLWQFSLRYDESALANWTWRKLADDGALMQHSAEIFESLSDCTKDAIKHGYGDERGDDGDFPSAFVRTD